MSAARVRVAGAFAGVIVAVAGGALAGGWWWGVGGLGAVAAVGGVLDRQLAYLQVLASLTLVAGTTGAGHGWFVPALAAGTVVSIELAAAADGTSIVHPRPSDLARVARTASLVVTVSAPVLVVGSFSTTATFAPVVAALAAVMAIRVVAR